MAEVIPVVDLTDFSSQESPRASPRGSKRPRSEGQDVSLASPVHHHVRKAVHRGERGDVWPPHPEEWGNEDEVEVEVEVAQERSSPLMAVLCTLPGVKPDAVTALLEEGMGVDEAVDRLLSMPGGYPKVPAAEKPAKSEENQDGGKDFSDSSWATSLPYQREAISRLTSDFPTVTTTSVKQVFSAARYHYYFAHRRLTELLAAKTPASGQPESLLQICRVNFISNRRKSKYQPTMDPVLQMELDWMRERELKEQEEKDLAMARELNQDEAERTGNLLECGCCFCEFAFEEMVSCTEGHLFCRSCLARFAKEKVFGQGRCDKVGCMSSDGCEGIFIDDFLSMVLDGPTFRRLQARTCETLAKEVFGDSLFHCPHCDTAAEVPEGVHIFSCPNSACELETCTLCNEPAHVPQRCEEVEKKEETNCRKTVEEAMSEAKIRKCPKCKKRFVKESGCNKMTCTCGAISKSCLSCYALPPAPCAPYSYPHPLSVLLMSEANQRLPAFLPDSQLSAWILQQMQTLHE
jgi:TRIAD3 protein (E3 ubiquitin-protein ligase RNF216)